MEEKLSEEQKAQIVSEIIDAVADFCVTARHELVTDLQPTISVDSDDFAHVRFDKGNKPFNPHHWTEMPMVFKVPLQKDCAKGFTDDLQSRIRIEKQRRELARDHVVANDNAPAKPFAQQLFSACKEFADKVREQLGIPLAFEIIACRDGNGANVVFYRGGLPMTLGDFHGQEDVSLGRYYACHTVREIPTQTHQAREYQHVRHFRECLDKFFSDAKNRQTAAEKAAALQQQIDQVRAGAGSLMQIDCADLGTDAFHGESAWKAWGWIAVWLLIGVLFLEFIFGILAAYDTSQAVVIAEAIHADLIAEHLQAGMFHCVAASVLSAGAIAGLVWWLYRGGKE